MIMKTISIFKKCSVVIVMMACCFVNKNFAQDAKAEKKKQQAEKIRIIVADSQHYVFVPQTAMPMSGGAKQLSYGYNLVISKDKLESYLPYYGRAYTADYGATKSPLDFTSTDFAYTITNRKKGGWEVLIEIRDIKEANKMQLTIYDNGSATLQVMSNNRQPISFSGNVEAVKPKEEK